MNNYVTHAQNEFRAAGWLNENGTYKDSMQQLICEHVLRLLCVFDGEGHSGSSAPYAINLFSKLANFDPIVPLTGEDWEWNEVSEGVFQNKRCGHVFKDVNQFNGNAYDIDAVIFYAFYDRDLYEDEVGYPGTVKEKSYFTGFDSRRVVEFPYIPKSEYMESTAE